MAIVLSTAAAAPHETTGPREVRKFDDLRQTVLERAGRSRQGLDLRNQVEVLRTVTFDTRTRWPAKDLMPDGFDPARILEIGINPGLGIRALHDEGITGKGVRVAVIDQPLLPNHREYVGRLAKYTPIDCLFVEPQIHGAVVASLLVGERCGVAPGATLFYWAEPMWKRDYAQRTAALRQIIAFNEGKPLEQRIRVVSVSIGFVQEYANLAKWKETLRDAESSGLIVVHCSGPIGGLRCPTESDPNATASYTTCYYLQRSSNRVPPELIYAPIDNRTTASCEGTTDYIFWAEGGLSWATPYLAGVIALGLQVNPSLDVESVWTLLRETGDPFDGGWIVNPGRFVKRAAQSK